VRFYFVKIPTNIRNELITRIELDKILIVTNLFNRLKAIEA